MRRISIENRFFNRQIYLTTEFITMSRNNGETKGGQFSILRNVANSSCKYENWIQSWQGTRFIGILKKWCIYRSSSTYCMCLFLCTLHLGNNYKFNYMNLVRIRCNAFIFKTWQALRSAAFWVATAPRFIQMHRKLYL